MEDPEKKIPILDNAQNDKQTDKIEIELIDYNQSDNKKSETSNPIDKLPKIIRWSRADEKIINKYITKAYAYKTLYNRTYFLYCSYYRIITWPLIFVTCLSLGLQIISATFINISHTCPNDGIFSIITTTISISVSILTYLQARTSYDNLARNCRKAGTAFSEFADQLNTILTIDRKNRGLPIQTINTVQQDYKKLLLLYSEDEIPTSVYKKFVLENKDNGLLIDVSPDNVFNSYDRSIEKNIVINKFLDSIVESRDHINLEYEA